MTFRVVLQPEAERDIRRQALWLAERSRSKSTALRWARSIRKKIATLAVNPRRCPIDPDSDAYGEEVRMLLHGQRFSKFRILFLIRGGTIRVISVRHAAQRTRLEEEADPDEVGDNDR